MKKITPLIAFILLIIWSCEEENLNSTISTAELQIQLDSTNLAHKAAELQWHLDSAKTAQDSLAALLNDTTSELSLSSSRIMTYEPSFSFYPLRLVHRRNWDSNNEIDSEYANSSLNWNANGQLINDQTKRSKLFSRFASGVEGAVLKTSSSATMYTFHVGAGNDDKKIYNTYSSDGTNWVATVYPNWKTPSKMGATEFNDNMYLFWVNSVDTDRIDWGDVNGNYYG